MNIKRFIIHSCLVAAILAFGAGAVLADAGASGSVTSPPSSISVPPDVSSSGNLSQSGSPGAAYPSSPSASSEVSRDQYRNRAAFPSEPGPPPSAPSQPRVGASGAYSSPASPQGMGTPAYPQSGQAPMTGSAAVSGGETGAGASVPSPAPPTAGQAPSTGAAPEQPRTAYSGEPGTAQEFPRGATGGSQLVPGGSTVVGNEPRSMYPDMPRSGQAGSMQQAQPGASSGMSSSGQAAPSDTGVTPTTPPSSSGQQPSQQMPQSPRSMPRY